MNEIVRIVIADALQLPAGFIAKSPTKYVIYCRIPADWLKDGRLKWEKCELFFAELYGKTWQSGNEDGSRYIVESVTSEIVPPEERSPWLEAVNDREFIFLFYRTTDGGELQKVTAAELAA